MSVLKPSVRSRCLAAVCVGALLSATGCSGDGGGNGTMNPPTAAEPADDQSNGLVSVDEEALQGEAEGRTLRLSIPVRAAADAHGTFNVTLEEADGQKSIAENKVAYAMRAGEEKMFEVGLTLPKDLSAQGELTRYKVRVVQGGARPLRVTKSLLYVLQPYDVQLEGPAKLRSEKKGSYRVRVQDPRTRKPRVDAVVQLVLMVDQDEVLTLDGKTDESGSAVFEVEPPESGEYRVLARAVQQGTKVELVESVAVEEPGQKVLLTSDKPIYQPGQVMNLRALALESPSNTPVAREKVVFEVEDGKGNKVLKKTVKSDDYGIASTRFALASVVNMGTYTVRALLGEKMGQKTVEVSRYVLPKFDVALGADKAWYAPGQTVTATLDAHYFFGKQVNAGRVVVEASTLDVGANVFQRVMGMTDADGKMEFTIKLPSALAGIPLQDGNALVTLRATVTDSAEQEVTKELALTVAAQAVRLSLVPEATVLVPGVENRLHVFATDPLGAPVRGADMTFVVGDTTLDAKTDTFGHAQLQWLPDVADAPIAVSLVTAEGDKVAQTFQFGAQEGGEHVLVRTDKSVYALGETVAVQVFASNSETRVYVDWLNEGQAVDMRTLDVDKVGTATFKMPLDASLIGENRIEAYVVDEDGNTVRAGRTIVVNREGALHVALAADKDQYRPGDAAELTLSVTDEQGKPAVAALGVQIVDEAVFGLIDARPGLLRTFFELEDAFATPQYEIDGPIVNFEQVVFDEAQDSDKKRAAAAQQKVEASLAALRGRSMMGIHIASWVQTVKEGQDALTPFYGEEKKRIVEVLTPLVKTERDALAAQGCTAEQGYCDAMQSSFAQLLAERVAARAGLVDFWGNTYADGVEYGSTAAHLVTRGPDEQENTADDFAIDIGFDAFDIAIGGDRTSSEEGGDDAFGPCAGGCQAPGAAAGDFQNAGAAGNGAVPPMAAGSGGATAAPSGTSDDGAQDPGVRVRREFPETLYVNPSLITDADGKATISLDMADSITKWRVSAMASSASGQLGGGQAGVTVFQDFFVDVNFPSDADARRRSRVPDRCSTTT